MTFKLKSGNKPGFKQMGATKAIKQVDTSSTGYPSQDKSKMHTEREIYKAKLRGDYVDATGDKLKKMSYDDPTGTVVSRDPHYLDSPAKQKPGGSAGEAIDHWIKYKAKKKPTSKMPKNFNMTGKDTWVEESKKILKKNKKVVKKPTSTLSRITETFKKTPKQLTKGVGKTALKGAGQIAKRFLGPVGAAWTAFDVGKWAYKNREDIAKQAKKVKKKRFDNPSDHGRPKY